MLASSLRRHPFLDTMVDDNMEIYSEHDYNPGDEDIDIDIDLTGAAVDEDHILEDVMSNAGFGNGHDQQFTLPTTHDDLMVDDDDNESTQMEDAGVSDVGDMHLTQDNASNNMKDPPQTMSFDAVDDINIQFDDDDGEADVQFHQETDDPWEYNEAEPESTAQSGEHLIDPGEAFEHNDEDPEVDVQPGSVLNDKNEDRIQAPAQEASSLPSPRLSSPKREESVRASSESSGSAVKLLASNDVGVADDKFDVHQSDEVESLDHIEKADNLASIHSVKVVYQDTEYSLFSTSGSDDPDSYFLSDLSICMHPLPDFFTAIRNIIHEDISEDEVLCVIIEDLGLEFQEEPSSSQGFTFWNIVELHQSLQKNDGVEQPQPLFIVLDKKLNSYYRFAHMVARAAEGTGLAELVTWDNGTTHVEQSAEDAEAPLEDNQEHDQEFDHTHEQNNDGDEHDTGKETAKVAETEISVTEVSESSGFEHRTKQRESTMSKNPAQKSHELLEQSTIGATGNSANETQVNESTESEYPQSPAVSITVHDNRKYSEEDLIDYSDDEFEAPDSKQLTISQPNQTETDDSNTHNEFEKKDEELRRRSLSRINNNIDDEDGDINYSVALDPETNKITGLMNGEDSIDYDDESPDDKSGLGNGVVQHETSVTGGEVYQSKAESKEVENEFLTDGDFSVDFPDEDEFEIGRDQLESTTLDQDDFDDELDLSENYEHDASTSGQLEESIGIDSRQIATADISQTLPKGSYKNIGVSDQADAESAGSDNTLVAQPGRDFEDGEDEIGYDEDEDEVAAIQKVVSKTSALSPPATASLNKRARSDASFDDGVESNGAKRTRS